MQAYSSEVGALCAFILVQSAVSFASISWIADFRALYTVWQEHLLAWLTCCCSLTLLAVNDVV